MQNKDYSSIPRPTRLAVFLVMIGVESAAPILKTLSEAQRDAVVRAMSELDVIEESLQRKVLQEFSGLLVEQSDVMRSDYDTAVAFMENAFGVEEAERVTSMFGTPKPVQRVRAQFAHKSAKQIWDALSQEDAQTIAYVLSSIEAEQAAEVVRLMEEEMAKDVVLRMSQLSPTLTSLLPRIAERVCAAAPEISKPSLVGLGGAKHIADVLKAFDAERSKEILASIQASNEELAQLISKEMFSFSDLVDLPQDSIQLVMREVDSAMLVVAMKTAEPELLEKIYGSLSKRGAEALKDEFEMQGQLKRSEVEAAQDVILQIVQRLEQEGTISLGGAAGEEADEYV